jgi:hypothetical protein
MDDGGQFWLWLNDLSETGENISIDGVGLGESADARIKLKKLYPSIEV